MLIRLRSLGLITIFDSRFVEPWLCILVYTYFRSNIACLQPHVLRLGKSGTRDGYEVLRALGGRAALQHYRGCART